MGLQVFAQGRARFEPFEAGRIIVSITTDHGDHHELVAQSPVHAHQRLREFSDMAGIAIVEKDIPDDLAALNLGGKSSRSRRIQPLLHPNGKYPHSLRMVHGA